MMSWMTWQKVWIPTLLFVIALYVRHRLKRPNFKWLNERCVLISGAGSGLGLALAILLNKLGAKVILCGRNTDRLQQAVASLPRKDVKSWIFQLDLSQPESINGIVEQMATEVDCRVDILINNAGQSYRGSILNTELSVHEHLMKVNYLGHVALTVAWLKHLRSSRSSTPSDITCTEGTSGKDWAVFVSSIQGKFSIPYRSAYSAPKHAIQAFADCLRAEQSALPDGVKVLVASPGYIKTELSRNALRDTGESHGRMDETTAKGKKPEDVAHDIVTALSKGEGEINIAPPLHVCVIALRALWPSLFFTIMAKRAARGDPY